MLTFPNLISSLFFHATVEIKLVQSNHYQLTKIIRPFKITRNKSDQKGGRQWDSVPCVIHQVGEKSHIVP